MTELMVNPPTTDFCSLETVEQYNNEKLVIYESMKRRAMIVTDALN